MDGVRLVLPFISLGNSNVTWWWQLTDWMHNSVTFEFQLKQNSKVWSVYEAIERNVLIGWQLVVVRLQSYRLRHLHEWSTIVESNNKLLLYNPEITSTFTQSWDFINFFINKLLIIYQIQCVWYLWYDAGVFGPYARLLRWKSASDWRTLLAPNTALQTAW